jgi:excisionase family DNA binding protein
MTSRPVEPLWTVEELATFLGVPVATLYQWRHRRIGPRACRVGRHLRYDPADVRAWLVERAA